MPSDRKPKPVRAWAVVNPDARFMADSLGCPVIWMAREDAAFDALRINGAHPIRVLITPEPSDA